MAQEETQLQANEEMAEDKTFTQVEVDEIIKKRLARAKNDVPADYKELQDKAAKFDELQEANKSELQKANEQLEKLKADIAKRDAQDKANALKNKISKETGVPSELIIGSDEDEMKDWAQKLVEYAKKDTAPVIMNAGKFARSTKSENSDTPYRAIARQLAEQMKGM